MQRCDKCGHTHNENEDCRCARCLACGISGDLTEITCRKSAEITRNLDRFFRSGAYKVMEQEDQRAQNGADDDT